jgi:hypothetical protein
MTHKTILSNEPLAMTTGEWRLRLTELCCDCAGALHGEEAEQLGLAHDLLALAAQAPVHSLGELLDHLPPRARFEALLGSGAFDSAALMLVPESASYILSRSGDGACLASVLLPQMDEEMTSEADSPAMALVSALLACLASVAEGLDASSPIERGDNRLEPTHRSQGAARCGDLAEDVAIWQVPPGTLLN